MFKIFRSLIPILSLVMVCSCKKLIEDKKRDLLTTIVTDGTWYVDEFMEGSATITEQFDGFGFHFTEDGFVVAAKGSDSLTGSWVGNIQNYTINANFQGASDPLKKLNGTWKVIDSSVTTVEAEMGITPDKKILHLKKKS